MNIIRCILAAFFAILIANPACCCAATMPSSHHQVEKKESHSKCCEEKSKPAKEAPGHGHTACNCDEGPRALTEQPRVTIAAPEFVLPELFSSKVPFEDLVRETAAPAPVAILADTGPHLRRLALFQRFLI